MNTLEKRIQVERNKEELIKKVKEEYRQAVLETNKKYTHIQRPEAIQMQGVGKKAEQ